MPGKSIRIFLVDGSTSGVRTAELGLSTIKALVIPRASLSTVTKRPEVQKTGVYLLIGNDASNLGMRKIYVGEGDIVWTRLAAHNKDANKDFWEEAVLFVSKDENLTKAHVRYLEARLIALAGEAKRCSVANGTGPSEQGKLPETDTDEMEEFISQVRLLLGALGYDLFGPAPTVSNTVAGGAPLTSPANEFFFSGKGYQATCSVDIEAGQYIVRTGSTARLSEAAALSGTTYSNLRTQLAANGVLKKNPTCLKFTQDYAFNSISAAAAVVSGQSINGRTAWKTKDTKKSFAEWQDAQLSAGAGNAPED